MVYLIHSGDNILKINDILKVAQKRFGLYGLEKTTMKEIAADLNMSKASLYYYFPDKEHLFKAVIETEQTEFFRLVESTFETISDPADMLRTFVSIRLRYFKTFFNLSRLRHEELKSMKPLLGDIFNQLRSHEIEVVEQILAKGVESKQFQIINTVEVATLFLETIKGLRSQVLYNKELMYVEPDEYTVLEKKLNMFTDIFIRGLSANN